MSQQPDAALNAVLSKVSWRILPILLLAYVFNYIDRIDLSFAALGMATTTGLTPQAYGFGAGLFFLGYFFLEVPSNLIMRRVGAPVWLFRIAISWGLCSMAMALVVGDKSFYVLRFLLGVAEAGFIPGMVYYLTQWYPNTERARVLGTMWASTAFSAVIAGPWSGLILMADGWMGLHGWQLIFLIQGCPTLVIGFVILMRLPRNLEAANWLTVGERQRLAAELQADLESNAGNVRHDFREAMRDGRVWLLGFLFFLNGFTFFSIVLWLPQIIKQIGSTSNVQAAFLTAIPFLVAGIVMIINGWHSDRSDERRWHLTIPYLFGGIALVVSATVSDPIIAFVAICVAAAGTLGPIGVFWSIPTKFLTGAAAAAGLALINAFGAASGFVGPYLVGLLRAATSDFQIALLVLSAGAFVATLVAFFLPYGRMIGTADTTSHPSSSPREIAI